MTFKLIIPQSSPLDPSGRVSREWQLFFLDLGNAIIASGTVTNTSGDLTADQLVVGNGGADVKTLAAGTAGFVVTMVGGIPTWAASAGGGITQLTGDVLVGPGSGVLASLFDLTVRHAWQASQYSVPQAITDAATTAAIDARTGNNWRLLTTAAVGATRAIPNPTNLSTGMLLNFEIVQPAAGGPCAVTWGALFKWGVGGTGAAPSSSTAANAVDFYSGYCAADGNIYIVQLGQAGATGPTGPAGTPGPAFKVMMTTDQNIAYAAATKVAYDTVLYDTSTYWDAANFRFKPLVAGKYRFVVNMIVDTTAGAVADWGTIAVYFNGAQIQVATIVGVFAGGQVRMNHVVDYDMNGTTDYVEAFGYVNSGSSTPRFRGYTAPLIFNAFSGSFLHT